MSGLARMWPLLLVALLVVLLAGCATAPSRQLDTLMAKERQADTAYAQGDLPVALRTYEELTRALPRQAPLWFYLGNVRVKLGQPHRAMADYEHALQLDPHYAKAWYNLGIVRLRLAEAAFVQAASSPESQALRPQSERMADRIAHVTGIPAARAGPPGTQPPVPADAERSGNP